MTELKQKMGVSPQLWHTCPSVTDYGSSRQKWFSIEPDELAPAYELFQNGFSLIFHEFKSFLPNMELASYGNYNILQKENCFLPAYSYEDKSIN